MSVTDLAEAIRTNAYKTQKLRFRCVYWSDKQGMGISKAQLPKIEAHDGWRRSKSIETYRSLIWVNHEQLQTLAYFNGEFALEEHATESSFLEALNNWEELTQSCADQKGDIFAWTTQS